MATIKQVSASVRKNLGKLAGPGGTLTLDGTTVTVPAGLDFTVRATSTGVNITIEDRGWVDQVTAGDRRKLSDHKAEQDAVVAAVDFVRGFFSPPLPGDTRWGLIIISARATGVRSA